MSNSIKDDILIHYGMPFRSGRYPYGSGEDPYQHNRDFLGRVEELKKNGWKETAENIKKEFNMTTSEYRSEISLASNERKMLQRARAKSLKEDGLNTTEIGRMMGVNESTVRSWLDKNSGKKIGEGKKTAEFLKTQIDEKGMIDVGLGIERELNVSRETMRQALMLLEKDGYKVYGGRVDQVTNAGKKTTIKVACKPGTEHKEIFDLDNIKTINDYCSHDGGETFDKIERPSSLDSKRVKIRYAEEGGLDKDGIIEIRRNVPDLSLCGSKYAQVRIMVDNDRYLKGMAVYSDDLPDGVDVVFNTNKPLGTEPKDVMKKIKDDPDNPFGALIKAGGQNYYIDKNGERKLSPINKTREEGDWNDWSNGLPSQFLSKQSLSLAKKQLNLAIADKVSEYDEIKNLTNPTIKKYYLKKFAEECDSAAVHLQAASLPGQHYHVIIPLPSIGDNEVYAPRYPNGTKLALVRYPHGGIFEIPILTVNNKNQVARKLLGTDSIDAVCINKTVANQLSGADFDGDTVMCIPTHDKGGKVKIASSPPLEGLKDFDPKSYQYDKKTVDSNGEEHYYRNGIEFRVMRNKQKEMGVISNLINDMTLLGASNDELELAVKHSMVVIDAEKHKLDYKQSELDNRILALKNKYQNGGGASTLISRAKSQYTVDKRQGNPLINAIDKKYYDPTKPEGALIYKPADDLYYPVRSYDKKTKNVSLTTESGKKISYNIENKDDVEKYKPVKNVDELGNVTYTNKDGSITYKIKKRTEKSTSMAETDDAYSLISETKKPMEIAYADYANKMKSLANDARKEIIYTKKINYSKDAKNIYTDEVDSLNMKLHIAELNSPKERRAQILSNIEIKEKLMQNPDMSKEDLKKLKTRTINKYRIEVGSIARKERNIIVTDKEWEAIQAGAVSENILKRILENSDPDSLRQRAMPKTSNELSKAKINRINALRNSNYTISEIAEKLGVSTTIINKYIKGD